jgi:ribosome-binding protein aMBF1 (putative translation factor)
MNDASFGNWLKTRRRALGLTQDELAHQVYCAEITIRKIEADQLRPSKQLAELLVSALQVTATEQAMFVQLARQRHGLALPWQ